MKRGCGDLLIAIRHQADPDQRERVLLKGYSHSYVASISRCRQKDECYHPREQPYHISGCLVGRWDGILTYDLDVIGGVDLPSLIGHPAGVFATLLRRQVPQSQRPLLLTAFANLLRRQQPVVLQPDDLRPRVPTGHALEPHRAADGALYPPFPHLGRVGEARANLMGKRTRRLVRSQWRIEPQKSQIMNNHWL